MARGESYRFFKTSQGAIRHLSLDYSGEYCLTSGSDKSIKLWKPNIQTLLFKYSGHSDEVLQSLSTRDNSKIISAGKDAKALLWDVETGKINRKYHNFIGPVTSIALNHDNNSEGRGEVQMFFAGSTDGKLKGFDLRSNTSQSIITFDEAKDAISSVDVEGYCIACSTANGSLFSYDLANCRAYHDKVVENTKSINCIKLINNGSSCLISATDDRISLINLNNGSLVHDLDLKQIKFSGYKISFAIDQLQNTLLCGSSHSKIYKYDLNSRQLKQIYEMNKFGTINCVSMAQNKSNNDEPLYIASSSDYVICF